MVMPDRDHEEYIDGVAVPEQVSCLDDAENQGGRKRLRTAGNKRMSSVPVFYSNALVPSGVDSGQTRQKVHSA